MEEWTAIPRHQFNYSFTGSRGTDSDSYFESAERLNYAPGAAAITEPELFERGRLSFATWNNITLKKCAIIPRSANPGYGDSTSRTMFSTAPAFRERGCTLRQYVSR